VSGRRGGEAAKFGTRYEGRWTVARLLDVLGGTADALVVEDEAALAEGAEFTLHRPRRVEVHQTKLGGAGAASWTLGALEAKGVLAAAASHARAGREFHFVSPTPASWLNTLADAARRSVDHEALTRIHIQSGKARKQLDLAEEIWGGAEATWEILRMIRVGWPDERHLEATNAALAAVYLEGGEGPLLASGLADLIMSNTGLRLEAETVYGLAPDHGMRRGTVLTQRPTVAAAVAATLRQWQETAAPRVLKPAIPRVEAELLAGLLRDAPQRVLLVAGAAGAGKSSVLSQAVDGLEGWPVLALRVDRRKRFSTPAELGEQLGLTASPVTVLGALAGDRPSLLLIDQLDAVSLASGRLPDELEPILEMVREAEAFPQMRVLLACRQYDLDNDPRLRELVGQDGPARLETVGPLDRAQIDTAVRGLGLEPGRLSDEQRALLALPLNLVLLATVRDQADALGFASTADLLRAFYARKEIAAQNRAAPATVRFWAVVTKLALAMSERQQLSVPAAVLDVAGLSADARVLASEGVLVRDGDRIAFFHEALFDYAFAHAWVAGTDDLHGWLVAGDQELFRRSQVRQILVHLHDAEPRRFRREVVACLRDPAVRFHLKDVIVGVLAAMRDPTHEDWEMLMALRESEPALAGRLRSALWSEAWFRRADAEGALEPWLDSRDEELIGMALEILRGGVAHHGARVGELVGRIEEIDEYPRAVVWLARSPSGVVPRAIFDRVLRLVREHRLPVAEHDLFVIFFRLHEDHPGWTCELVETWLAAQSAEPAVQGDRIAALESHDHGAVQAILGAARGAPDEFVAHLLPVALNAMKRTAIDSAFRPRPDHHFFYRDIAERHHNVGEALVSGLAIGLRHLGEADPEALKLAIAPLLSTDYDAAQWLAYQGLIGAGDALATYVADVLLEAPWRLESGYMTDPFWTTRELLLAMGGALDDQRLGALEREIMRLSDDQAYAGFTLLTGLPEARLSEEGEARLVVLREEIGLDQPEAPPPTVQEVTVESPVAEEDAAGLDDDAWLAAMAEHAQDERARMEGGARELARVLEPLAKRQPERFARLGLRIDETYNPVYLEALLTAVADPEQTLEDLEPVFDLMRHVAGLSIAELDRWVGWPLNGLAEAPIPDDIIELVLDRALRAGSPGPAPTLVERKSVDLLAAGLNSARGQAASVLARLVAADQDGRRTALVADSLGQLAADRSLAVRACVARLLVAAMSHAREEAVAAAGTLLDADDALLASPAVQELCFWLDDDVIVRRMLNAALGDVRDAGGQLAAYVAIERGRSGLMAEALRAGPEARRGAVLMCARRIAVAGDAALAAATVRDAFDDEDEGVRKAAAGVAVPLRGKALRPHAELLLALIGAAAFDAALSQLATTLEYAPDRVDDLLAATVERFLERFGDESRSIANSAAASSHELGKLVMHWYEQAEAPAERARALDLLDQMLEADSFGVKEMVVEAER
jgi:hypothetical protein